MDEEQNRYAGHQTARGGSARLMAYVPRGVKPFERWMINVFFIFNGNQDVSVYHVSREGRGVGPLKVATYELQDAVSAFAAEPKCHTSPIEFFHTSFPDSKIVEHSKPS